MSDFVVHKLYVKLLDNVSAGADVTSDPLNIQSISTYCAHISWSSLTAVNPAVTLLASNSLSEPFVQIDSFIPSGTSGGRLINVERTGYAYVMAAYTCDSGSGTLMVSINGKV